MSLLATAVGHLITASTGPVSPCPRVPEVAASAPAARARRLVVKLGTRVLVDASGGPRLDRLEALACSVAALRAEGREVIVVSSGAVGLGSGLLGFSTPPCDAQLRRACAAVGQARLMTLYQSAFALHGLVTAQVLLTGDDLDAERRCGVRATLEHLLVSGVVPVVNENDVVRLAAGPEGDQASLFRDNDGLAAQVAAGCAAELLLLLTDVDGVYHRDPRQFPGEQALSRVDDAEALLDHLWRAAEAPASGFSRGGMHSKVAAALLASRSACDVVIASGDTPGVIERLMAGDAIGTLFPSRLTTHDPHQETA